MVMFYIHFHSLKGLEPGHGDRVGLYRLPFLQVDSLNRLDIKVTFAAPRKRVLCLGSGWPGTPTQSHLQSFPPAQAGGLLPVPIPQVKLVNLSSRLSCFALRGDNGVAGASIPFQLRLEPGERALQDELGGLETKYSSLLHHSETLQKELEVKQQSFVVLEQQHKSMQEEAKKKAQMEADLAELVAAR